MKAVLCTIVTTCTWWMEGGDLLEPDAVEWIVQDEPHGYRRERLVEQASGLLIGCSTMNHVSTMRAINRVGGGGGASTTLVCL